MTISATYAPDTYAGDGSTTTFAITFNFLSVSTNVKVSIKVTSTSVVTEKTAGTHYNVSGSNVVFTAGNIPAVGEDVIIELNPDFKQTSDYTENSAFPANTLETDLDERTLESQYLNDQIQRSVRVDAGVDITTFDPTLPTPAADKFIGFNGDATAMVTKTVAQLGTLSLPVGISDGGTGSTTAAAALSALGGLGNIVEDTTPQLGGQLDVNGNAIGDGTLELLAFTETGSAVNHLNITNNTTGNAPSLTSVGDDTNVGLTIDCKGTGTLTLGSVDVPVVLETDTIDAKTGGSSRLDISDSGVRLGGANARVTTILDEDTMSSDSATALATQQSIKAYVDSASGGGKVLQTATAAKTDTFTTTSTSFTVVTGLATSSLTPADTNSKFLVLAQISYSGTSSQHLRLERQIGGGGWSAVSVGDAAGSRPQATTGINMPTTADFVGSSVVAFLDSPATASGVEYRIAIKAQSSTTAYINRGQTDTDDANHARYTCNITAIEIGA